MNALNAPVPAPVPALVSTAPLTAPCSAPFAPHSATAPQPAVWGPAGATEGGRRCDDGRPSPPVIVMELPWAGSSRSAPPLAGAASGWPLRCGLSAIRAYRIALLAPAMSGLGRAARLAITQLTEGPEVPPDLLAEAARAALALGEGDWATRLLARSRRRDGEEGRWVERAWLCPVEPPDLPRGSSGQRADAWADEAARALGRGDRVSAGEALRLGLVQRPHHAELRLLDLLLGADARLPDALRPAERGGFLSLERWRRRVAFRPAGSSGAPSAWSTLREDGVTHPRLQSPAALAALPPGHLAVRMERLVDRWVDGERFGVPCLRAADALRRLGLRPDPAWVRGR